MEAEPEQPKLHLEAVDLGCLVKVLQVRVGQRRLRIQMGEKGGREKGVNLHPTRVTPKRSQKKKSETNTFAPKLGARFRKKKGKTISFLPTWVAACPPRPGFPDRSPAMVRPETTCPGAKTVKAGHGSV